MVVVIYEHMDAQAGSTVKAAIERMRKQARPLFTHPPQSPGLESNSFAAVITYIMNAWNLPHSSSGHDIYHSFPTKPRSKRLLDIIARHYAFLSMHILYMSLWQLKIDHIRSRIYRVARG